MSGFSAAVSAFLAILNRELRAYFVSPLGYAILTFFLFGNGVVFVLIISHLSNPTFAGSITPLQLFFTSAFYWFVLFVVTPVLTMRLLSEERRSGTIETLMTSPVSEIQVVVAKYLAALVFYVFLWLPTVLYTVMIAGKSSIDWGPVAAGYLGVFGMGAMFLAIGIFGSAFTKSQIVAAIATFAMTFTLFIVGFLTDLATHETVKSVLEYTSLLTHMEDFAKGIVDTRRLIYYFTTVVLFLFLTSRVLAAKKWR